MIEDGEKENIGKKEKVKTARERTQRLLKKTARVRTLKSQMKTARVRTEELLNSQGKDPSTFEGGSHQVERWPVEEKRKEEKWKKWKKRKRRRR